MDFSKLVEFAKTIRTVAVIIIGTFGILTTSFLVADVMDNLRCKRVSTFLSPWFFRSDKNAAFGSDYYCCDFDQIQKIITTNKTPWGEVANVSSQSI